MASIVAGVITILSTIIRQEYEFLRGLRGELQSIKDEFQLMMAFLEGADLLVHDHPGVRIWVGLVRDVAYDVEDVLDEFVMHCTYPGPTRWYGVCRNMYAKSGRAIKAQHELENRIQGIKKRIKDISDSHGRYKHIYRYLLREQGLSPRFSRVNNMQYDRRGDALLLDEADLVGIERPKRELINLILKRDGRRNVIAIVGMGGLGKTTLVKKVYDDVDVKSKFTHHAWITVSESFKLEELFKDTIRQICNEEDRQLPQGLNDMNIDKLRLVVKDLLRTKKYIVVFDDVWQPTHWKNIQLAFPRNHFGSRIVITTRKREVCQAATTSEAGGRVYRMKALRTAEALRLFCRKAFSGDTSCPRHLKETCKKILEVCKGLPLAIEVIGSNLARKSRRTEEWELFYKGLGAEMEHYDMTKLLSLSYHDLPLRLQNCFLYMSIFPEDTQVHTGLLSQLWIGEGFVERIDGMTLELEEVAERYVNELVDRCLLQVAATDDQGSIVAIRVHDIIRKVILLKSMEHNLITICSGQERMSFQHNVRRLSVQGTLSNNSKQAQDHCKSLRTLYLCKSVGGHISQSCLSNLLSNGKKLLRVLDLKGVQSQKFTDEIFKLSHLRYLNLQNTNVRYIPKSIINLQSLQYLILLGTKVTVLPVEIQKLQHLRHLLVGRVYPNPFVQRFEDLKGVRAPFRIGNLLSLRQLYHIEADQVDKIKVVTEIGKLIHLRLLGITKLKRTDGKELCSSLGKLRELRQLNVQSVNEEEFIDLQYFKSSDLPRLQLLILAGRLEKCPELISSLNRVTRIELLYSKLPDGDDPLKCLHDLPNLITLHLTAAYQGESFRFQAGGFPKLKELYLLSLEKLRFVIVEEDAMPSLEDWRMRACPSMEEIPTTIEHLMCLQDLRFSNMSDEFVNKLENLDKQSAAYKRLLQVPRVVIATWTDGEWSEVRRLSKETGTFNKSAFYFTSTMNRLFY